MLQQEEEKKKKKSREEINLRARTATLMNATAHYRTTLGFSCSLQCSKATLLLLRRSERERERERKGATRQTRSFICIYLTVALNWQLITYSKDLIRRSCRSRPGFHSFSLIPSAASYLCCLFALLNQVRRSCFTINRRNNNAAAVLLLLLLQTREKGLRRKKKNQLLLLLLTLIAINTN